MPAWSTAVAVVASVVGGAAVVWPLLVELEVRKCERPKYAVVRRLAAAAAAAGGASVEIRRYAPILLAERMVDAPDMKAAGGQGFRALAGFIFGKNESKQGGAAGGEGGGDKKKTTVAMTSPVIMEMKDDVAAAASNKQTIKMTSPVIMEMKGGDNNAAASSSANDDNSSRIRATMAFTMPSKWSLDTLPKPLDPSVRVREQPARTVATLQFRGQVRSKKAYEGPAARLRAALEADGVRVKGPLEVYQYYPPFTWGFLRVNEVALEVEDEGVAGGAGGEGAPLKTAAS